MKRLLLFMIFILQNHMQLSADSANKTPVLLTGSQALDTWWNKDTGKVSENYILTEHQKQEALENPFHCDFSSCDRRDVRRAILVVAASSVAGAIAMPHLAVPILSFGGIATLSLGAQLVMHKAPEDKKIIKRE